MSERPKLHELKTWPASFRAVKAGKKTAEFRRNDRDFQEGEWAYLREWSPETDYTGEEMYVRITHVLNGPAFGVPEGFAMLSISDEDDEGSSMVSWLALDRAHKAHLEHIAALEAIGDRLEKYLERISQEAQQPEGQS